MFSRIAVKLTDEGLAKVSELTGAPADIFGDETYILFEVISVEPVEFHAKFMTEEQILAELENDSEMEILGM